ncbi:unnamed protein product [Mesocestoides corti]|uniref:polynucleotide adenylyltransferase n=1 Tax=Mesocestoides corti TaxID=53468 RepID=A0A0R3UK76_MESCO|nr:unnamed protein product [Mesocestoides corti]
MKVEGTSVDLIMSRLNLPYVPNPLVFNQKPEKFYSNVDHFSVHGLSGLHLSQKIRELVPDFSLFTDLLKVIKIWTSRRLIKDYVYGFPASVAWAILCAYICINTASNSSDSGTYLGLLDQTVATDSAEFQSGNRSNDASFLRDFVAAISPMGSSSKSQIIPNDVGCRNRGSNHRLTLLVQIFFTYFSHWVWPSPVVLAPVISVPQLRLYSWDPKCDSQNGHDLMPIITPIFPHKNAAYTVRPSSRDIVVKELQRGCRLVRRIIRGSANWEELFEPYDISQDHRLTLSADNYQELVRLGGLIDSRLRDLASFLEEHEFIQAVRITKASDLPKSGLSSRQSLGCHSSENDADNKDEACFSRTWLLGMKMVQATPLPDGTQPERQIDVTEYLIRFYGILHERDSRTNFLEKLVASYVTK